jgi:hypothetical protein
MVIEYVSTPHLPFHQNQTPLERCQEIPQFKNQCLILTEAIITKLNPGKGFHPIEFCKAEQLCE